MSQAEVLNVIAVPLSLSLARLFGTCPSVLYGAVRSLVGCLVLILMLEAHLPSNDLLNLSSEKAKKIEREEDTHKLLLGICMLRRVNWHHGLNSLLGPH